MGDKLNALYGKYHRACLAFFKRQFAYYSAYFKKSLWREKIAGRGIKRIIKELLPACVVMFASCFMMFVYEPILLYSTNKNDLWFDFGMMILPLFVIFALFLLGGIAVMSVIYFINLFFSGRVIVYKIITLVLFISFFLLCLQGNFLSDKLPILTGEKIIWENYGKTENVILLIALIALVIAAIILVRKVKLDRTLFHASVGASLVSLMLVVTLVSTVIENDTFRRSSMFTKEDTFVATTKNFNNVSSNKNFLIFLVDAVDSKFLYDIMNQDGDFKGVFEDFTYYPDTLALYPFTARSIPAMLTGAVHRQETAFLDYCRKAYNESPLFKNLMQRGYEINLYSSMDVLWHGQRSFEIENAISIHDAKIMINRFKIQLWKYVRFKYLPYRYKRYSHIENMDFNVCKMGKDKKTDFYHWGNKLNYDHIQKNPTLTKEDRNFFSFIHVEGGHVPLDMDKYFNSIQNGTYEQKVAASLTLIKAYLQRLKANNAYDNSVIIVISDHGFFPYSGELNARANPILFIKGFKEKHEMKISDIPVSHTDLRKAFADLLEDKKSADLFTDIEHGRTRTFLCYRYDGSEFRNEIVEFTTTGKAWEIDKLTPTGNVYKLKK